MSSCLHWWLCQEGTFSVAPGHLLINLLNHDHFTSVYTAVQEKDALVKVMKNLYSGGVGQCERELPIDLTISGVFHMQAAWSSYSLLPRQHIRMMLISHF